MQLNILVRASRAAIFVALVSLTTKVLAVDEPNPTGVSGIFNGNIATADSISTYDSWTKNIQRGPIVDVQVPSAQGAYGLRSVEHIIAKISTACNPRPQ